MGLRRRLYGTGHEASGQGHYGSGKLERTQPAGDQRRREAERDPDLIGVDRLRSHACQYLPERWAETLEPSAGPSGNGVDRGLRDRRPKGGDRVEEVRDAQEWSSAVPDQ